MLVYGSVTDQETVYSSTPLYNPLQSLSSNVSPNPSTAYEHFATAVVSVYIYPSWSVFFMVFLTMRTIVSHNYKITASILNPSCSQPIFQILIKFLLFLKIDLYQY